MAIQQHNGLSLISLLAFLIASVACDRSRAFVAKDALCFFNLSTLDKPVVPGDITVTVGNDIIIFGGNHTLPEQWKLSKVGENGGEKKWWESGKQKAPNVWTAHGVQGEAVALEHFCVEVQLVGQCGGGPYTLEIAERKWKFASEQITCDTSVTSTVNTQWTKDEAIVTLPAVVSHAQATEVTYHIRIPLPTSQEEFLNKQLQAHGVNLVTAGAELEPGFLLITARFNSSGANSLTVSGLPDKCLDSMKGTVQVVASGLSVKYQLPTICLAEEPVSEFYNRTFKTVPKFAAQASTASVPVVSHPGPINCANPGPNSFFHFSNGAQLAHGMGSSLQFLSSNDYFSRYQKIANHGTGNGLGTLPAFVPSQLKPNYCIGASLDIGSTTGDLAVKSQILNAYFPLPKDKKWVVHWAEVDDQGDILKEGGYDIDTTGPAACGGVSGTPALTNYMAVQLFVNRLDSTQFDDPASAYFSRDGGQSSLCKQTVRMWHPIGNGNGARKVLFIIKNADNTNAVIKPASPPAVLQVGMLVSQGLYCYTKFPTDYPEYICPVDYANGEMKCVTKCSECPSFGYNYPNPGANAGRLCVALDGMAGGSGGVAIYPDACATPGQVKCNAAACAPGVCSGCSNNPIKGYDNICVNSCPADFILCPSTATGEDVKCVRNCLDCPGFPIGVNFDSNLDYTTNSEECQALNADADGDGLSNEEECPTYLSGRCRDTDGDTLQDWRDTYDRGGSSTLTSTFTPFKSDTNGNGIPDYIEFDDSDTVSNECPGGMPCRDTDGDGKPDYADADDDDDAVLTSAECVTSCGIHDEDSDGILSYVDREETTSGTTASNDSDFDGLDDDVECPLGFPNCPDSDGDTIPDYMDPDDDNDMKSTRNECPTKPCATTGGIANYLQPNCGSKFACTTSSGVKGCATNCWWECEGKVASSGTCIENLIVKLSPGVGTVQPVGGNLVVTITFQHVPVLPESRLTLKIKTGAGAWGNVASKVDIAASTLITSKSIVWDTQTNLVADSEYEVVLETLREADGTTDIPGKFPNLPRTWKYLFTTKTTAGQQHSITDKLRFILSIDLTDYQKNKLIGALEEHNVPGTDGLVLSYSPVATSGSTIVTIAFDNLAPNSAQHVIDYLFNVLPTPEFQVSLQARNQGTVVTGSIVIVTGAAITLNSLVNTPSNVGAKTSVTIDFTTTVNIDAAGKIEVLFPFDWVLDSDASKFGMTSAGGGTFTPISVSGNTVTWGYTGATPATNVVLVIDANLDAITMPPNCLNLNGWVWGLILYDISNVQEHIYLGNPATDRCHGNSAIVFGDPHFKSFSGGYYDITGTAGYIYNVITDEAFLWNSMFISDDTTQGRTRQTMYTFLGLSGFRIFDRTVIYDPITDNVTLDGAALPNSPDRIELIVGSPQWYVKKESKLMILRAPGFRIALKRVSTISGRGHRKNIPHFDHVVDLIAEEIVHPHGLLGQTATRTSPVHPVDHKGTGIIEGSLHEYYVDDVLSASFRFNRFGLTKADVQKQASHWSSQWFTHAATEQTMKDDGNAVVEPKHSNFFVTHARPIKLMEHGDASFVYFNHSDVECIIQAHRKAVSTVAIQLKSGGSIIIFAEARQTVVNQTAISAPLPVLIGHVKNNVPVEVQDLDGGVVINFKGIFKLYLRRDNPASPTLASQLEIFYDELLKQSNGILIESLVHPKHNIKTGKYLAH